MKIIRNVTDFDPGADVPQGAIGVGTTIAAGDLTGTHGVPTISKIGGATISGTPAAGEAIVATSTSAAAWATVVSPNPLTTEGDMIYEHSSVPTRLAVGSAHQLIHGGTDPSYSAVVEADITLANNTTDNVSTSAHGFAPILPNDATRYLDGTGVYSVPPGSGGGGGLAQSFVGYNTIGGTWTTLSNFKYFLKQITLVAASTFTSIDAYLRPSTDNIALRWGATVLSDVAGAPSVLLAGGEFVETYLSNSASMPGAGRWLSIPVGAHLAAGTYWIGVGGSTGAGNFDMANDGSGSDVTFVVGGSNFYITGAYPSAWTITTGSVKWSIRASILS